MAVAHKDRAKARASIATMTTPVMEDNHLTTAALRRTCNLAVQRPLQLEVLTPMPSVSLSWPCSLAKSRANLRTDGGYENYVALWWQSQMSQQAQGQGGAGQAPGTS